MVAVLCFGLGVVVGVLALWQLAVVRIGALGMCGGALFRWHAHCVSDMSAEVRVPLMFAQVLAPPLCVNASAGALGNIENRRSAETAPFRHSTF